MQNRQTLSASSSAIQFREFASKVRGIANCDIHERIDFIEILPRDKHALGSLYKKARFLSVIGNRLEMTIVIRYPGLADFHLPTRF